MTIQLPPALDRLVRDKVASGLYNSETEVVCEALRREFDRETVEEQLRTQVAAGFAQLDDGEFEELTREEFFSRFACGGKTEACD